MKIECKDWKKDVKNTRQGYFTLIIDDIAIKQCVLHKHPAGKVWFAPPAIQTQSGYFNVVQILDPEKQAAIQAEVVRQLEPKL